MKTYKLIIEKNKDGFWGSLDKLSSVFSYGSTLDELQTNMIEAIELYFEELDKPLPKFKFELVMDIQEFFEINDFINISSLAKRIGMNSSLLRQYSKGIKYPGLNQVSKIEKAIKEIGAELLKTELQPSTK